MTVSLTHQRVSTQPDGGDPALIQPSDWNQSHVLTCASGVVLGRTTSGSGVVEELSINGLIGSPGYYGVFQDTTTQTIASTSTAYVIAIGTQVEASGFSIVSGNRLTAAYAGTYNVQFSIQLQNADTTTQEVNVWFRKNGTDLTDSNSVFSVHSQHGGTNGALIAALNYMITLAAGDYLQLAWSATSTQVSIVTAPAQTTPVVPETPGVILTAQQVMNVQAGPGVAAGGTTGQILRKNSGTDYDTAWWTAGTMASQDASAVAITGGTINGTALGATTPASGVFTTLTANVSAAFGAGSANYLTAAGAATTYTPIHAAAGSDTNVSLAMKSQGTGAITLAAGSKGAIVSNGNTVTALTLTSSGASYTGIPTATIAPPTAPGGVQATVSVTMFTSAATVAAGGSGYTVGDTLTITGGTYTTQGTYTVATVSGGAVTSVTRASGAGYSVLPSNPVSTTGGTGTGCTLTVLWTVNTTLTNAGSGYLEQPAVTFSGGGGSGAAAYATVGSATRVQSLGSTLSFYTPGGESFRVVDFGGTSAAYWQAYGAASIPDIRSTGAGTISSTGSNQVSLRTNTTTEQFRVAHTASAVNYLQATGGASGAPGVVTLSAQGSSTDVDMAFTPRGAGVVKFGTYTTLGLEVLAGYITIKDAGGTVRKLAVIA